MAEAPEKPSDETVAKAGLAEVFGAVTLVNPTWTILRHPLAFARYRQPPGAAIHYLYAGIGLAMLAEKWTDTHPDESGGDVAPILALINRALAQIGPHAHIDGGDGIIVGLLIGNLVSGVTAYWTCRLWKRFRSGAEEASAPALPTLAAQTMAATAYFGGAASVFFALGLLLGHGDTNSPPATAAGVVLLFLVYCWGRWIRTIHDVARNPFVGAVFPFALAMVCMLLFVGLAETLKAVAEALGGHAAP